MKQYPLYSSAYEKSTGIECFRQKVIKESNGKRNVNAVPHV